jgi:hypothetical protein
LSYFIGLNSVQKIKIDDLDDFNYSMIEKIIDPEQILEVTISMNKNTEIFLGLFKNLKSLTLNEISTQLDFK